ncbi:hypothetical protein DXT88_06435 [Herbaspirillum lusitanum]|nr:hypothetical protein [Herbaspirillum lusitanum]
MLEKAKRERSRLEESLTIDNVFNFFVTARHIVDYAKNGSQIPLAAIEKLAQDTDHKALCDVGDMGKHLLLTKPKTGASPVASRKGTHFFTSPFGTVPFGDIKYEWELIVGGQEIVLFEFADRVLEKWETLLSSYGL